MLMKRALNTKSWLTKESSQRGRGWDSSLPSALGSSLPSSLPERHKERGCCLAAAEKGTKGTAGTPCHGARRDGGKLSWLHPPPSGIPGSTRGGLAPWPAVSTQVTVSFLCQQWPRWGTAPARTGSQGSCRQEERSSKALVNEAPSALPQFPE